MNQVKTESAIGAIFNASYREVFGLGNSYTAALVWEIFDRLSLRGRFGGNFFSAEDAKRSFGFVPQGAAALDWLLEFLAFNGLLEKEAPGGRYRLTPDGPGETSGAIADAILRLDKDWEVFLRLMTLAADDYPAFLKGEKRGVDILFSADRIQCWHDYFCNKYSAYTAFNELGAVAVAQEAAASPAPGNGGVDLLEIGGGTGGATVRLLDLLARHDERGRIKSYVFSDIAPSFLRWGAGVLAEKLDSQIPRSLKRIDLNSDLAAQGLAKGSFDLVYGVNTLHVVKNLRRTLGDIRASLRPGGALIACEVARPGRGIPVFLELLFCLLESYTNIEKDPDCRSSFGFLTKEEWRKAFELSGFREIELLDDANRSGEPGGKEIALVIKGRAPR